MQMLARSWRSVRQLSPAERKQLAKAVGADGAEGVLDRIAAHKGRVSASFLVPAIEKFRGMDPDALVRLIEALRDPERRRQVLEKSASAVGDVLIEGPTEESETEPAIEDQEDLEAEVEPVPPPPPLAPPRIEVAAVPPPPVPVRDKPITSVVAPDEELEFEEVRGAPTLGRQLALARRAIDDTSGWTAIRIRALLDLFSQDWARRRVLVEALKRGLVPDTSQAIDLIGSLESRGSRRWCVSLLSHQRELSETERQTLRALR
jgi:hypothetical protein